MSPLTKARRRRSATNTPRCEQPGQRVGGRSGRSATASGTSTSRPSSTPGTPASESSRATRPGLNSPQSGRMSLPPSTCTPCRRMFSSRNGSSSSTTYSLSTLERKLGDEPLGQRPAHAQLQEARLRERLLGGAVGRARRDDAHAGVAHLDPVELRRLRVLRELEQTLLHGGVPRDGVVRHHQLLRRVALELEQRPRRRHALAEPRDTLRVRGAGGRPVQHRRAEALAHLVRGLDEAQRLVGVRRLDHRHLRELGVVAVVLLVLRAVHRRVVGGHDHEAAGHMDHERREERVGGDVETDVLHRRDAPWRRRARRRRRLDGHLLVGRPLARRRRRTWPAPP